MKRAILFLILFTLFLVLGTNQPAFAHKIRIFAWNNGDNTIVTESKFSGGKPAKKVSVSVIESATGRKILSGKTDIEGMFDFPIPKIRGNMLEIVVSGGDGHKNSWNFTLENKADSPVSKHTTRDRPAAENVIKHQTTIQPVAATTTMDCNPAHLTLLIEAALDRKLAPIKRALAENTDTSPTLQDILGGIGYILGLAGIAAYFQSRKTKQE